MRKVNMLSKEKVEKTRPLKKSCKRMAGEGLCAQVMRVKP